MSLKLPSGATATIPLKVFWVPVYLRSRPWAQTSFSAVERSSANDGLGLGSAHVCVQFLVQLLPIPRSR